jgi:DNA invertase Pin-like site-specific DNA recombinase
MRYVTYYRVSTTMQGHDGLGMQAQQRDISQYMQHHAAEGEKIIGKFSEVIRGGTEQPPQLLAAVAMCKRSGAALLVAKLDRVSRRISVVVNLMDSIQIKVACMPHAGNFELHLYAALAEQERAFISQRTKDAMAAAKANGATFGGRHGKTMQANKAKQAAATASAEKYRGLIASGVANDQTLQQMADTLEDASGEKFYPMKVKRMIERLHMQKHG